ncbi:MAG TPA: hypothetical protein PKI03_02900 [Pseudomonadota bacterium]|nr:hypothetical protein [Pseudomonadota bacterium]
MYTPRQGLVHCVMTYRERISPIRSFPKLLHEALADDPEFVPGERNQITRFVTNEGEYAAMIIVHGTYRERALAHIVSSVFADDFCTLIDARVEAPYVDEYAQLVMTLAKADQLQLNVRRRRFGFMPPKGWHVVAGQGLDVALLPPEYPRVHGAITVYPAEPAQTAQDPHTLQNLHDERVGLGSVSESQQWAMTGSPERRLRGEQWRTVRKLPQAGGPSAQMVRYLVVLRDEHYFYTLKLETLDGPHVEPLHQAFVEVIGTIEPIPLPLAARGRGRDLSKMWCD